MVLRYISDLLFLYVVAGGFIAVSGFALSEKQRFLSTFPAFVSTQRKHQRPPRLWQSTSTNDHESDTSSTEDQYTVVAVVAPLKYLGPYPCLTLRFPNLSSAEQRKDNKSGVTLDFVLDTGANVNTIDVKFVKELDLPLVISSKDLDILGSAGIGGTLTPGDTFALGDCELVGLPPEQTTTFMRNLTAAGLGFSTPVGNGLLSLSFFLSFPAGVEFDWHGTDGDPPTLIFYYGKELPTFNNVRQGLVRVPLERLPVGLTSLTVNINGTDIPALLDTGAPITVLNQEAVELAGIEMVQASLGAGILGKQSYGDENLMVGGVDGVPVNLYRSVSPVPIRAGKVSLGEGPVYIGDLPGLKMAGTMAGTPLPAVVLGLDSLRRSYRMILRAPADEVWFEELHNQLDGS